MLAILLIAVGLAAIIIGIAFFLLLQSGKNVFFISIKILAIVSIFSGAATIFSMVLWYLSVR